MAKSKLLLLLLPLLILLIYWNGLSGPLLLDDGPQLVPLMENITSENWKATAKQYILSNSSQLKRPIPMVSFIANAILSGNKIWYWKLTNVLLHSLCSLLVFLVTYQLLLLEYKTKQKKYIILVSLLVSALWATHPLHVSTTLYLVQRMVILETLFIFFAFYCFIYGIKKEHEEKSGTPFFLLSFGVFFPLSVLSKETGFLFPIFILLLDHYIHARNKEFSESFKKKRNIYLFVTYSILAIGLVALVIFFKPIVLDGYATRSFTLYERILTEPRVLFYYIYQVFIPLPLNMGFFHDDFIITKSLFNPFSSLVAIFFILILLLGSVKYLKILGLIPFGILFYFSSHLLESTLLPLEIAFEHRNYIGTWGLLLSASVLLTNKFKYSPVYLSIILLIFSGLTTYRASIWGDSNKLFPHFLSAHPNSPRVKIIFADAYSRAGKYDQALGYLENGSNLGTHLQRLTINCAKEGYLAEGELLALQTYDNIKIGTHEMEGLITLANLGLDEKCIFNPLNFITILDTVLKKPIINPVAEQKLLLYKAHYHHKLLQFELAKESLYASWRKEQKNPIPLFLLIDWLIETGQDAEATKVFSTAEEVALNSWYDYSDFIISAKIKLNKLDDTVTHDDP